MRADGTFEPFHLPPEALAQAGPTDTATSQAADAQTDAPQTDVTQTGATADTNTALVPTQGSQLASTTKRGFAESQAGRQTTTTDATRW